MDIIKDELSEMKDKYGVILIDPPWAYQNWTEIKHGAASAQYRTMSVDEMKKIPLAEWAAKDCVVAMWASCTSTVMAFPATPSCFAVTRSVGRAGAA